jgi:hypothetical protein
MNVRHFPVENTVHGGMKAFVYGYESLLPRTGNEEPFSLVT